MDWNQALRRIRPRFVRGPTSVENGAIRAGTPRRAGSICVVSGKGGTGKSVVTASLASLLTARGRTLIVDADMGVGNAHILQDVSPQASFVDVVQGRATVLEIVTACRPNLDLLCAGSGVSRMAGLSPYELHVIAEGIRDLEGRYEYLIVDSAAGISEQTVAFAAASDLVLVVTTPDPTAMTDAYAFIKVLVAKRPGLIPLLLVNRVDECGEDQEHSGAHVYRRLAQVCLKFLGSEPRWVGSLPEDRAMVRSVAARQPVVVHEPGSACAVALQALSVPILSALARDSHVGLGRSLVRDLAYSPARKRMG